jgi:hypothetical protein
MKKLQVVLLVLVAVLSMAPIYAASNSSDNGKELVEMGKPDSKTFRRADGSYRTIISNQPQYYKDPVVFEQR